MKSKLCEEVIISFYTNDDLFYLCLLNIFFAGDPWIFLSSKPENLWILKIGSCYAKIDETLQHRVSRFSEDTFATIISYYLFFFSFITSIIIIALLLLSSFSTFSLYHAYLLEDHPPRHFILYVVIHREDERLGENSHLLA